MTDLRTDGVLETLACLKIVQTQFGDHKDGPDSNKSRQLRKNVGFANLNNIAMTNSFQKWLRF